MCVINDIIGIKRTILISTFLFLNASSTIAGGVLGCLHLCSSITVTYVVIVRKKVKWKIILEIINGWVVLKNSICKMFCLQISFVVPTTLNFWSSSMTTCLAWAWSEKVQQHCFLMCAQACPASGCKICEPEELICQTRLILVRETGLSRSFLTSSLITHIFSSHIVTMLFHAIICLVSFPNLSILSITLV